MGSYSVHVGGFSIAFEAIPCDCGPCTYGPMGQRWVIRAPQMEDFMADSLDFARDVIRAHYLDITNTIDPGDYL